MTDDDALRHIRPIDIDPDELRAWEELGRRVEQLSPALLLEVHELWRDPCLHRIQRCAKAARYIAAHAEQPWRGELIAQAEAWEARGQ